MASSTASSAPAASLERRLGLGRRAGGGMGLGLLLSPTDGADGPPAPPMPGLMRLRCAVQHYEWGRRGADSLVARLAAGAGAGEGTGEDDGRPCAELWMGTHPSAPSSLAPDVSLRDWIARNPAALGRDVAARWGGDLPFLFKVRRSKLLLLSRQPFRH
jgi:mannose-6-phosphate isomerase